LNIAPTLTSLTVHEFLTLLASDAPAPGGGSVAALNVALGAALVEMVAGLTLGRQRYAEVAEHMQELQSQAHALRHLAERLMEEDSAAYLGVVAAYALPRTTPEEREKRQEAILQGTREAIKVPLATAQASLELLALAIQGVDKGNENACSDALVAGTLASGGCQGALDNVLINLDELEDPEEYAGYLAQVQEIKDKEAKLALELKVWRKARLGDD